jgi:hypothetical protein
MAERFAAPFSGVSPGVLGTVVLGRAGYEQVTATMLDLASRGHLKITRLDLIWWELEAAGGRDELRDYEQVLMQELGVRTGPERFPNLTNRSSDKIAAALVGEAANGGWFAYDPARRRRTALLWCGVAALTAFVIALVLSVFVAQGGYGFLLVVVALLALLLATRRGSPRRTEDGEKLAERGLAFREALDDHPREVDAQWFPYAVALGRSAEFARVLAVRHEPIPQWVVAKNRPTLTWADISDLALEGSLLGLSASSALGPIVGNP